MDTRKLFLINLFIFGIQFISIAQTKQPVSKSNFPNCVFYEIFVGSYFDTNNDSIGDLKGVTVKLDYLNETGIEAIILSPVSWSMSTDKMDAIEFSIIDPQYGTIDDLKELISESHKKNLKVILSMNMNYTGIHHPWFDEAKASPSSSFRNYYVWKNVSDISEDKSHWFGLNKKSEEKYFSYEGEQFPCLNLDFVPLQNRLIATLKSWVDAGIDGVKFIDPDKICIDKKQMNNYWRNVVTELRKGKPDLYIIFQNEENGLAVCDFLPKQSAGIFLPEVTSSIRTVISNEKDNGITTQFKKLADSVSNSGNSITMLTTLNTINSGRFASDVNSEQKNKLAMALLLTLPGSPVLFYGDEIGLKGLKKDYHNLEPFIWQKDDDSRAQGISNLYNDEFQTKPLNQQTSDANSTYNLVQKLSWIRKSNEVMNKGQIISCDVKTLGVLSFYREYGRRQMLVLHNLSYKDAEVNLELLKLPPYKIYYSNSAGIKPHGILKLSPYSTTLLQLY